MKNFWLPLASILFLFSCGNQKSVDEIREAINKSRQTEAAPVPEDYTIDVITDPLEVERIKSEIETALAAREEEVPEEDIATEPSIVDQYKNGNKVVIPEIIYALGFGDSLTRATTYEELGLTWKAPKDYSIKESSLINAVYSHFNHPEDAEKAIDLAAQMKLKGVNEKLEQKALSNNLNGVGRAFFYLGLNENTNEKIVLRLFKLIASDKLPETELDNIAQAIKYFADDVHPKTKTPALEAAMLLYEKKIVPILKNEDAENQFNNLTYHVLTALFENGDEKIIPIAENLIERNIYWQNALSALIRISGKEATPYVLGHLKSPEHYESAVYIAADLYKIHPDPEIPREILKGLQKVEELKNYNVQNAIYYLRQMGAESILNRTDEILEVDLVKKRVKQTWAIMNMSCEEIANDLFNLGLIASPIDKTNIATVTKELKENDYEYSCLNSILYNSGIYTYVYMEEGYFDDSQESVAQSLSENSKGLFSNILFIEETMGTEDYPEYKFTMIFNDKAYIGTSAEYGYKMIVAMANKAMEDTGLDARFHIVGEMEDYILFGEEITVNEFANKYWL